MSTNEGPVHTRFEDSDGEDGECSNSPKRVHDDEPDLTDLEALGFCVDRLEAQNTDFSETLFKAETSIVDDSVLDDSVAERSSLSDWQRSLCVLNSSATEDSFSEVKSAVKEPSRKRNKPTCYNCGKDHVLSACTERRDMKRIREAQNAQRQQSQQRVDNGRYHEPVGSLADMGEKKYKPGKLSQELRNALGIGPDDIPEWIYRMRKLGFIHGYPPGYLKKALSHGEPENVVLSFHLADGKVEGGTKEEDDDRVSPPPSLDSSKIIYYCGFNQTYRKLRDREQNFRVPPFDDFVELHKHNTLKEYEERVKLRKLARPNKRKSAGNDDVQVIPAAEDNDCMIISDGKSDDDDIIIIDRYPKEENETDTTSEANTNADDSINIRSKTPECNTPQGSSLSMSSGTPVPIRRRGENVISAERPDILNFSIGIQPFVQDEEAPLEKRGFFKRMKETLLGKQN